MSLKAAPRREVLEVRRVGDWGEVAYHHRLACGHTEVRKRPAKAPQMACASCLLVRSLPSPTQPIATVAAPDDMVDPVQAELALVEGRAGRLRAGLAATLRIPLDAVDVVIGDVDGQLRILSVLVHLEADEAERVVTIHQ